MFTKLFRIEGPWQGQLAVSARPRGGDWLEEELHGWRGEGIDVIVSLLVPEEVDDLDLLHEKACSETSGIEFLSFPITDRDIPARGADIHHFLGEIDLRLNQGKSVVIHCRQGVGRAGLIVSALLIERGLKAESAIQRVSAARGVPIPETREQRLWIDSFAAALMANPTAAS
jgi:protein-tyrosine phosphatase